jgi:hypothetical protein
MRVEEEEEEEQQQQQKKPQQETLKLATVATVQSGWS